MQLSRTARCPAERSTVADSLAENAKDLRRDLLGWAFQLPPDLVETETKCAPSPMCLAKPWKRGRWTS